MRPMANDRNAESGREILHDGSGSASLPAQDDNEIVLAALRKQFEVERYKKAEYLAQRRKEKRQIFSLRNAQRKII